jgi:hypothetical protein
VANLDVSNHTGPLESIAGHDITELATLVYVCHSSSECVTQLQTCAILTKTLGTGNFGGKHSRKCSHLVLIDHFKTFYAIFCGFWAILSSRATYNETRRIIAVFGRLGYNGANFPTIDHSRP